MDRQISVLGWVLIVFTMLLIISLFVSLFTRLKEKGREANWINAMRDAGNTIRDPFAEENRKMQELSEKVESLRKPPDDNPLKVDGSLEAGDEE